MKTFAPIKINKLRDDAQIPTYETAGSAGADLRACLGQDMEIHIEPGHRALIPLGLKMEICHGFEVQIRPRSGLALKQGVTVLNTPGTIDSDYRGEVCVLLINLGDDRFIVHHGDRIAQMVMAPVTQATFLDADTDELTRTDRGTGGFGSTGTA